MLSGSSCPLWAGYCIIPVLFFSGLQYTALVPALPVLHQAGSVSYTHLDVYKRQATALDLLGWLRVLISIHALLAESDYLAAREPGHVRYFYPRSPCGERHKVGEFEGFHYEFLSTLSMRRATWMALNRLFGRSHLYTRSPCRERPKLKILSIFIILISIHALLAESDSKSAQNSGAFFCAYETNFIGIASSC